LAYKILVGLLAFLGLISSWLALKNLFGLLALFWPFLPDMKENIAIPFCNKCYIRRPHSDISNI